MPGTRLELLQGMPIFGAIRKDVLELLLERARVLTVDAGAYFFREAEAAESMFVLEFGRVLVLRSWGGGEMPLHELGPGDCFGEMAVMDLMPRSASVRALTACRAIEVGAHNLLRIFENDMEQFALIQMNMGREVCRRLRAADELLFQARVRALPSAGTPTG